MFWASLTHHQGLHSGIKQSFDNVIVSSLQQNGR